MPKLVRPAQGGINRSHPMSRRLVLSWQASGQAGGYNLHDKTRGVVTGTSTIGNSAFLGTTYNLTSSNHITFTRAYAAALVENVATFWIVGSPTSLSAYKDIMSSNTGDSTGWDVGSTNAGVLTVTESGGTHSSPITLVANAPYLLIVSMVYLTANFLALRLDTGVITTGTATVTAPTGTLGGCIIGATSGNQNATSFNFAAAALAYTGFSIPMLRNLANDPWGPWRPQSFPTELMVATAGGTITGTAAGTASASGAAAAQGIVAGTAPDAAIATGAAVAQETIAGVAAGAPTATGAAAAQDAIAGTAAGVPIVTGAAVALDAIAGTAAGAAAGIGAAVALDAIAGVAAGATTALGAAVALDAIAGVAAGATTAL